MSIEKRYYEARKEAADLDHARIEAEAAKRRVATQQAIREGQEFVNAIRSRFERGRNAKTENINKNFGLGFYDDTLHRNRAQTRERMDVLKIIRDVNPDASLALWNFLRLSNQGHEVECFSSSGKLDQKATDYINNEVAPRVGKLYGGGMDMLVNVLNLSTFTSGANAMEVELNDQLNDVVDFHVIDPGILHFRRNRQTDVVELCVKRDDGEIKVLNTEQVFYSPLDPDVGDPHGRSPILPTLHAIFFQIEVLSDLRAVVHHQGHARFDIKMMTENMKKNMPEHITQQGPAAIEAFINTVCDGIEDGFSELDPDDNLIHTDDVEIDMVGGKSGSIDITSLMSVIDRQVTASLKSLPVLLGRNESTSETHATIQWEIYKAGIRSMQNATKRTIEKAYKVALRVRGIQAKVTVTFNELSVRDRLKDAQAENMEIMNEIEKVNQGWIKNDDASIAITGSKAVDDPNPPPAPIIQQPPLPNPEDDEDFPKQQAEAKAATRSLINKSKPDPYIAEIPTDWAEEAAIYCTDTIPDVETELENELAKIVDLVEAAGMPPSDLLVEAKTLRMKYAGRPVAVKPEPPDLFSNWVKVIVLGDGFFSQQLNLFTDLLAGIVRGAATISGVSTLLELATGTQFNTKDRALLQYITTQSERSASLIRGESDKRVIQSLWDVVYEGDYTIPKATERLQQDYGFSKKRAKVIARTEIIGASHKGQFIADRQSGIVIAKTWNSALDGKTREPHVKADQQTVAFDEPFKVKGEYLLHPSDQSLGASPGNVIQCRCWYSRILQGEKWEPSP